MYDVDIRIDLVNRSVGKDTQIGDKIQQEHHPNIVELAPISINVGLFKLTLGLQQQKQKPPVEIAKQAI